MINVLIYIRRSGGKQLFCSPPPTPPLPDLLTFVKGVYENFL